MKLHFCFFICSFWVLILPVKAQKIDSIKTIQQAAPKTNPVKTEIHSPRKAAIRSAILPGAGQAYNRRYWKIPIVYAALGTSAGFFYYNLKEYQDARNAYKYKVDADPSNDFLIKEKFRPVDPESIRRYRNDVRLNVDYSVLAFLICWGLNVVDATVDAHLKSFDLSENLSMHIKPQVDPFIRSAGINLQFRIQKKPHAFSK